MFYLFSSLSNGNLFKFPPYSLFMSFEIPFTPTELVTKLPETEFGKWLVDNFKPSEYILEQNRIIIKGDVSHSDVELVNYNRERLDLLLAQEIICYIDFNEKENSIKYEGLFLSEKILSSDKTHLSARETTNIWGTLQGRQSDPESFASAWLLTDKQKRAKEKNVLENYLHFCEYTKLQSEKFQLIIDNTELDDLCELLEGEVPKTEEHKLLFFNKMLESYLFPLSVKDGVLHSSEKENYLVFANSIGSVTLPVFKEYYTLRSAKGNEMLDYLPFIREQVKNLPESLLERHIKKLVSGYSCYLRQGDSSVFVKNSLDYFAKNRSTRRKHLNHDDFELFLSKFQIDLNEIELTLQNSKFDLTDIETTRKRIKQALDKSEEMYAIKSAFTKKPASHYLDNLLLNLEIPHGENQGSFVSNGILLTQNGYVLTAYHVVDKPELNQAKAFDNKRNVYAFEHLVKTFDDLDLAIVKFQMNGFVLPTQIEIAKQFSYLDNEEVHLVGLYRGLVHRQSGVIIDSELMGRGPDIFITSINVRHGFSGSPIISNEGGLVGIAIEKKRETLSYNRESKWGNAICVKLGPLLNYLDNYIYENGAQ